MSRTRLFVLFFGFIIFCAPVFAANKDFWNKPYTPTNIEILQLRIENWETSRKADDVNYQATVKTDGYFYNTRLIDYGTEYKIRCTVWATDKKATQSRVISDMKILATLFLDKPFPRKEDWSDKIKLEVLYNSVGIMDEDKIIYDGYVKNDK